MINKSDQSLSWVFIAILLGEAGIARACEVVKPDLTINGDPLIVINRPGKYCIDQDYKFLCYPWRHSCSGKFLDVRGNNIDIDMRGHSLISINAPGYEGAYLIGSNIALRNGKIESGGTAVRMRSPGSPPFSAKYYDRNPMALPAYYAGNFVLENLTIRGEESVSAVGFSGSGLVMRNNVVSGRVVARGENIELVGNYLNIAEAVNQGARLGERFGVFIRDSKNIALTNNRITLYQDFKGAIAIWYSENWRVAGNAVTGASSNIDIYPPESP